MVRTSVSRQVHAMETIAPTRSRADRIGRQLTAADDEGLTVVSSGAGGLAGRVLAGRGARFPRRTRGAAEPVRAGDPNTACPSRLPDGRDGPAAGRAATPAADRRQPAGNTDRTFGVSRPASGRGAEPGRRTETPGHGG